jgi:membrane protein
LVRQVGQACRGALERFYRLDPTGLSRLPASAVGVLRVLLLGIREFIRDSGLQAAAGLAFTTILALVPVGILAFALFGAITEVFDLDLPGGVQSLLTDRGLPEAAAQAGKEISALIEQTDQASTGLGVLGAGFLVLTALGLYSALDRAFNRIWKVRKRRNALQRFRAFWFVITLGPVLVGVSVYATARLRSLAGGESGAMLGPVVHLVLFVLPFLLTWATFFFFYIYLPNTRVRPVSALIGAVLAGSVWEVAKWGFNMYVSNAVTINQIYGTLGILPIFILWIYVTWIVILVGVEISFAHQHRSALAAGAGGLDAERGATRELTALGLLLEVFEPFRAGRKPPDLVTLSSALVVRAETAQEILADLEKAGLVRRDSGGLYIPAREAAQVTLAQGAAAVRGPGVTVADLWATPTGEKIRRSFDAGEVVRAETLGATTIADVLAADQTVPGDA